MNIWTCIKEKKKNIIMFVIGVLLSIVIFLPWIEGHYSIDTYGVLEKRYDNYAVQNSLKDGRIVMAGFMRLAYWLNLDIIILVRITLIISIIITCIAIVYLNNIITEHIKIESKGIKMFTYIISYLIMFNFMYLDNLYFIECSVMSLSLILYLIASNILVNKQKGCWYKAMVLVILGMFCYQGTINFFITMTFVLSIIKYNKLNKQVIINMLICAFICLCAVVLNFLQIKIIEDIFDVKQTRIRGINTVFRNIQYIFIKIPEVIINTSNFLPQYIFIIFVLILLLFCYMYYIIKKQDEIYIVINIILICLVAYFSCFLVNLLSLSSFASGRLTFSIGALIGILFMYIFLKMPILESKKMQYIFCCVLLVYFLINTLNYLQKINLEVRTNEEDIEIVRKIEECIQEYEKNTGYIIKNISFATDSNCYKEKQNNFNSVMGNSAIYTIWARVGLINYWTNRNLKEIKMDEMIYNNYFKEKDWNEFNKNQCIFIEDKLYYCIY